MTWQYLLSVNWGYCWSNLVTFGYTRFLASETLEITGFYKS